MQPMDKVDMCLDDIIKSKKTKKHEALGNTNVIKLQLTPFLNIKSHSTPITEEAIIITEDLIE